MSRELTLKQQRFVKEYIKDGNATRAVREAYPNIKTEGARGVMASKLVSNGKVREEIAKALEAQGITPEVVINKFQNIAAQAKFDRDKISAWRNISDIAGYTSKGPQVVVGQNQSLDVNDILAELAKPKPIECTVDKQSVDSLPENKTEETSTDK